MEKTIIFTNRDNKCFNLYLNDIRKYDVCKNQDVETLAQEWQENHVAARDRLIKGNLRFVITIAKQYCQTGCIGFNDVVDEGNIGLIQAVDSYDPSRGFTFLSYASWLVKKYILAEIERQAFGCLNPSQRDIKSLRAIRKYLKRTANMDSFVPTDEDIAEALSLNQGTVILLRQLNAPIDLDTPVDGENEKCTLGDTLSGEEGRWADQDVIDVDSRQEILDCLAMLPTKEAQVLTLHFGINDGIEVTIANIASRMGISAERVRQLYLKGMADLPKIISSYRMAA